MDSERPHNEKHDSDAPLTRDDSDWFARELGAGWQPVEPGIYRFVGEESRETPASSGLTPGGDLGDALAPRRSHESDASDEARTKRWAPWRRD